MLTEEGKGFELINGELEEKAVSLLSSLVATKLNSRVSMFAEKARLGIVMQSNCTYQCFPHDPTRIRRPDGSYFRQERVTADLLEEGHVTEVPDWVQETTSPGETTWETDDKIEDYLRAGVKMVWEINPELRTVHVYRQDGSVSRLREHEELWGENVIPGFTCPVAELFPPREVPAKP